MRNVIDKSCRENKKTHILCSVPFFENYTIYEIMLKIIVENEGPQMMSQYGAYALRAGLARLYACMCMHMCTCLGTYMQSFTHKHAHTDQYVILNCFSTAAVISRTHLSVTLYVHCLSCNF